jgi:heme exporter protein C
MKNWWWKILSMIMLAYVFWAGLMNEVPALVILNESIRNLFFHVPLWFAMTLLLFIAMIYSIQYLLSEKIEHDQLSLSLIEVATLFGFLGFLSGMLWAKSTWGGWLPPDIKIIGASITLIFYGAFFILRNAIEQENKRARISAVYNIMACASMIIFIYVLPRLKGADSLHPGSGGNPGFNTYDLDSGLRLIFYPAVIAWILLSIWIASLRFRIRKLERLRLINKLYDIK